MKGICPDCQRRIQVRVSDGLLMRHGIDLGRGAAMDVCPGSSTSPAPATHYRSTVEGAIAEIEALRAQLSESDDASRWALDRALEILRRNFFPGDSKLGPPANPGAMYEESS